MPAIIDSDQHLFESPTMWRDYIDPAFRDDALAITEDEYWATPGSPGEDRQLDIADVQHTRRRPPPSAAAGSGACQNLPPEYRLRRSPPGGLLGSVGQGRII
jgi:hypothetical protein